MRDVLAYLLDPRNTSIAAMLTVAAGLGVIGWVKR